MEFFEFVEESANWGMKLSDEDSVVLNELWKAIHEKNYSKVSEKKYSKKECNNDKQCRYRTFSFTKSCTQVKMIARNSLTKL